MIKQKWEHMFITVAFPRQGVDKWRAKLLNGGTISNWKGGPDFPTYVRELGKEGWELVAVHEMVPTVGPPIDPVYIFKRPLGE